MLQQNPTADFRTIAIDQLQESPTNPRRTFDESRLQELAQSIRAQGILIPLIVRPTSVDVFEVSPGRAGSVPPRWRSCLRFRPV
jgi:ParB/RepB/Spo0J family partition protein